VKVAKRNKTGEQSRTELVTEKKVK